MAFDDKQLGTIFPTRTGTPTGSANERQMLDKTGAGGFIKSYRTLPDGTVVRLETKNGMPRFITDVSRQVTADIFYLEMDSGIVDLLSIHEGTSNYNLPGKIYQTDYVASHAGNNERAVGCGKIRTSDATGIVVPNGAQSISFKAGGNKVVANAAPSSMFTGKMRLYVQALYGSAWTALNLNSGFIGRPTLVVSANDGNATTLTTGSGLFTDPVTKKHYLIQPHSSSATIRELKATASAEKFRKFLTSENPLSEKDAERVEAYLLAYSIPDDTAQQTVTYATTPTEALGYSWHFNWDGSSCDIVDVQEVYVQSLSAWGFRTTHYRLNFSALNGVFSVSRQIVYGPHEWSVRRNKNVIAYPGWNGYLLKAGNNLSGSVAADQIGRVYAYYTKDELKTVDITVTKEISDPDVRLSEPEYFGGWATQGANYFIVEGHDGTSELKTNRKRSSVRFTCGNVVCGGDDESSMVSKLTFTWNGLTDFSAYDYGGQTVTGENGSGTSITLYSGEPTVVPEYNAGGALSRANLTYATFQSLPLGMTGINTSTIMVMKGRAYNLQWQRKDYDYSETTSWRTLLVIPHLDAEAVYLSAEKLTGKNGSLSARLEGAAGGQYVHSGPNQPQNSMNGDEYVVSYTTVANPNPPVITGPFFYKTYAALWLSQMGAQSAVESSTINESSTDKMPANLICTNGVIPAAPPNEAPFFSSAISVQQTYDTVTSPNGVTYSGHTSVESGSPIFPTHFTLVGWA